MKAKASKRMSSRTSKRKMQTSKLENGDHSTESATNGSVNENEELKGFTENELNTSQGVIKDVCVVLTRSTPIEELEASQNEVEDKTESEGNSSLEKRVTGSREANEKEEQVESEAGKRVTRSQTKENGEEAEQQAEADRSAKENGETVIEVEVKEVSDEEKVEGEDLEPLIIEPDETEPELQFDENSDRDSGKNSPASRCFTRRSQLRNMPTPKTPKFLPEKTPTPFIEDAAKLDDTFESLEAVDALSTEAEAGNDSTRANFTVHDEQPSEFLKSLKDKSLSETLRSISSRRTIGSRHLPRTDFHVPYPKRASVESVSGMKRKNRSPSPEERKRMKREASGLFSYIKSPVFGIRHPFGKDLPTSTPKLTGFRNKNSLLDGEEIDKIKLEVEDAQPEKKWCSIM